MKKLFFIAVFSVTAFANASNAATTSGQLPTPKDIAKYAEKELNVNSSKANNTDPGDDEIIITPPKKRQP